jgi:hypothetical protein
MLGVQEPYRLPLHDPRDAPNRRLIEGASRMAFTVWSIHPPTESFLLDRTV